MFILHIPETYKPDIDFIDKFPNLVTPWFKKLHNIIKANSRCPITNSDGCLLDDTVYWHNEWFPFYSKRYRNKKIICKLIEEEGEKTARARTKINIQYAWNLNLLYQEASGNLINEAIQRSTADKGAACVIHYPMKYWGYFQLKKKAALSKFEVCNSQLFFIGDYKTDENPWQVKIDVSQIFKGKYKVPIKWRCYHCNHVYQWKWDFDDIHEGLIYMLCWRCKKESRYSMTRFGELVEFEGEKK